VTDHTDKTNILQRYAPCLPRPLFLLPSLSPHPPTHTHAHHGVSEHPPEKGGSRRLTWAASRLAPRHARAFPSCGSCGRRMATSAVGYCT